MPASAAWRTWRAVINGLRGPAGSQVFAPPRRAASGNTVAAKPYLASTGRA